MLGQQGPKLCSDPGGHLRPRVAQLFRLVLDCLHHLGVLVPDVGAHQLRVHIDVALAASVPETGALCAREVDGRNCLPDGTVISELVVLAIRAPNAALHSERTTTT